MNTICGARFSLYTHTRCALAAHGADTQHYDPEYGFYWSDSTTDRDFLSTGSVSTGLSLYERDRLRMGQMLYNRLPEWVRGHVVGSLVDPFYTLTASHEITKWIDDHLIFSDEGKLIGYHDGDLLVECPD